VTLAELAQQNLAQQQTFAAFVSAGAAVVQAIGVVAAIIASIVLARQSANREDAARMAAAERERQADEAAERRARAADEAAERRSAQAIAAQLEAHTTASQAAHENLVTRALELTGKGLILLDAQIADWDSKASAGVQTNWGGGNFSSTQFNDIREALALLRDEALADTDLNLAISQFLRASDPRRGGSVVGKADVQADALRRLRVDWINAIDVIESRRQNLANRTS